MVIFHGCTLPRGWERMYPNYVGSEAVLASENMIFNQHFCDNEAFNATLHPLFATPWDVWSSAAPSSTSA